MFKNKSEGRLKAGWRILIFIVIFWCLSITALIVKPFFGEMTKSEYLNNFSLVIVSILAIAAVISVGISRKFLDKKSFISLGLSRHKGYLKDLLFGFLLSGVMAATFLLIAISCNVVEFEGLNLNNSINTDSYVDFISTFSFLALGVILIEHIMVGFWEELVFRGYLFQNMTEGMGLKLAISISCLIYGLVHITNPNATILSSAIIVAFGFVRIYGLLLTNMLWLSMGMHIGWNFFQGPVFGFAASGHQHVTLVNLKINGDNWLSGGQFGPEGSILIIPVLVFAIIAMRYWSKRHSLQKISTI